MVRWRCVPLLGPFVVPETRSLPATDDAGNPVGPQKPAATLPRPSGFSLLRNRNFLLISLVSLAIFFTRSGTQNTILPLLGSDRLGIGPAKLGYAFTAIAVINFLTISVSGILCDRYGRKTAIVPSCILCGQSLATPTPICIS